MKTPLVDGLNRVSEYDLYTGAGATGSPPGMWPHACGVQGNLSIGAGEDCPWCGAVEKSEAVEPGLREALVAQRDWHDSQRDDLGKQPPNGDNRWRRAQHQEQIDLIDTALLAALLTAAPACQRDGSPRREIGECCIPDQGEPSFVFLARDPQAPDLIETWARDRERLEPDSPKPAMARAVASDMRAWKLTHPDRGLASPPPDSAPASGETRELTAQEHGHMHAALRASWPLTSIQPTPGVDRAGVLEIAFRKLDNVSIQLRATGKADVAHVVDQAATMFRALQPAKPQSEWLQIESAMKDGTDAMLSWRGSGGGRRYGVGFYDGEGWRETVTAARVYPTHWQALSALEAGL